MVAILGTAPVSLECTGRAANLYAVLQGANATLRFFMVCSAWKTHWRTWKTHSAWFWLNLMGATVLVWPPVVSQPVRTIFSIALPGAVTFALSDFPGWATAVSACFGPMMNEGPPWTTEVRVTWHIGMWGATFSYCQDPLKIPFARQTTKNAWKTQQQTSLSNLQIFVALVYAADDFVNYTLMQLLCWA